VEFYRTDFRRFEDARSFGRRSGIRDLNMERRRPTWWTAFFISRNVGCLSKSSRAVKSQEVGAACKGRFYSPCLATIVFEDGIALARGRTSDFSAFQLARIAVAEF
jgi:hypothetical protein